MADVATYQCPNCNGVLAFDARTGTLSCAHCGSTFAAGEAGRPIPLGADDNRQVEHVTTVEGFLEHAPWEAEGANAANANTYLCPSCAAVIVADRSAVTASCPYCGNNMLVAGIATPDRLPSKVLPFTVSRDEAMARMRGHFQHKWYLSRRFSAQLEHLQGVYVPYYLYDLHVSGWADYIGEHEQTDPEGDTVTIGYKALHRAGRIDITALPEDASSKMPDAHMEAIAPFDFSKLQDFSTGYVAGFLAEVADEEVETCYPRAEACAREAFDRRLMADARHAHKVDSIDCVDGETTVELVRAQSCVLPVWLMHCTWEGEQMLFAVNGDTGKCVGDLPIDRTRRTVTLVVGLVLAAAIAGPLLVNLFGDDEAPDFLYAVAFFIIMIPFLIDMHFKSQMRSATEAETDGLDYSSDGLVVTERWDGPKFHLNPSKAMEDLKLRPNPRQVMEDPKLRPSPQHVRMPGPDQEPPRPSTHVVGGMRFPR